MFEQQLVAAVAAARTYPQINAAAAAIWKAHAAGLIPDAAAQEAAEQLHARKQLIGAGKAKNASTAFASHLRRHAPRSPDRERSIRRRRSCAACGAVPAGIAADFTTAEVAVLSIIAAEVRRSGSCSWPIDRIAALSGVCRRTAQYALRRAAALGLIQIDERPRPGAKHLPHVVTVINREWRAWLRLAHRMQKRACHVNPDGYTHPQPPRSLPQLSALPILSGSNSGKGPIWTPPSQRSPSKTSPRS